TVIAFDPDAPEALYAATVGGSIFKTFDGGASWIAIRDAGLDFSLAGFGTLVKVPGSLTLYAGTVSFFEHAGVFKGTDDGLTCHAARAGLSATTVAALAIDRITPSTLYAGISGTGIFKTTDGGNSWQFKPTADNPYGADPAITIAALAVDPLVPSIVYAGLGTG